jgi:copper(I)-binding protein
MAKRLYSAFSTLVSAVLLAAITTAAAGCQGAPPRISVENASAELSPVLHGEGMVYLAIENAGGKDALTGVKVDIPGATADLHEMRDGLMIVSRKMAIPAKSTVALRPGESHIMIENMPADKKEGSTFTLTLVFERSGEKQVPLTLKKARMPQMP